jgi:hypothetical protein
MEIGDYDKTLSYNTRQQLRIQDRYLGCLYYFITGLIVTYILVFVFVIDKAYNVYEEAEGSIATEVSGDAYGVSGESTEGARYFSAEDLTHPGLEAGTVFVSTRQKIFNQKRGVCEDRTKPCEIDEDCTKFLSGTCSEKGFCLEQSWCNVEDEPQSYEMDVSNVKIWRKSNVHFVQLAPENIYSTEDNHGGYPTEGYNMFSVRELLNLCEPVPVRYEEVSELGAAISVQFAWNCDVEKPRCTPEVTAKRVDVLFDKKNIGYSFTFAEYKSDDERLLYMVQGVRIYFATVGRGRKVSIVAALFAISTTTGLLGIANIFSDLIMIRFMSKGKTYRARKYDQSPDFSNAIDELIKEKNREAGLPGQMDEDDKALKKSEEEWHRKLHEDD